MWLPSIQGLIRRRVLVNYRVEPERLYPLLPERFRPLLVEGFGLVGICLIRLEQVRPAGMPAATGISSENAAHRIAVEWDDDDGHSRQGVFILRRDSDSWLNTLAGGRIFPGSHRRATFMVDDRSESLQIRIRGDDEMAIEIAARPSEAWPSESIFADLHAATAFHRDAARGYSFARDGRRCEGLRLLTPAWQAHAIEPATVRSSYFDNKCRFPPGSVALDHVLLVRDLPHTWHRIAALESRTACV